MIVTSPVSLAYVVAEKIIADRSYFFTHIKTASSLDSYTPMNIVLDTDIPPETIPSYTTITPTIIGLRQIPHLHISIDDTKLV